VERGLGNFLQKRTETTYLAKILQVFFFWKRKKKSIKRLSFENNKPQPVIARKTALW